jgi:protein-S-isoprenylcysteine O-methyltransferase Ste14
VNVVTLAESYVDTHAIGMVWFTVAAASGVIELVGAVRRRAEATRHDRGSQFVLRLCVVPGVIVLLRSPNIAPGAEIRPALVTVVIGIVLFAAGEALRVWAKLTLGRYFTYAVMTSGDQPVITSGPYQFVRHPSYTGVLLLAIGAGFVEANWLGLAALTLTTLVGLLYRIRVEERALLEELDEKYRSYAEHHARLIPFVW